MLSPLYTYVSTAPIVCFFFFGNNLRNSTICIYGINFEMKSKLLTVRRIPRHNCNMICAYLRLALQLLRADLIISLILSEGITNYLILDMNTRCRNLNNRYFNSHGLELCLLGLLYFEVMLISLVNTDYIWSTSEHATACVARIIVSRRVCHVIFTYV
jgi:hypothetical protein